MNSNLIPHDPFSSGLEPYRGGFQVPVDWTSCGPGIYISGAPGVREVQPVAVALTRDALSLCGSNGPVWSLPIASIKDIKLTNLAGVSFPVHTPAGLTYMTPPAAVGVEVSFNLTATGVVGRVIWCTLTPRSAQDWVNDITDAIYRYINGSSDVDRRESGQ